MSFKAAWLSLVLLGAIPTTPQIPTTASIIVQEQRHEEAFSGAGTGFSLRRPKGNASETIFGYCSNDEEALIRVSGKAYKVRQVSHKLVSKGRGKKGIGARTIEVWANPDIRLTFDYTVTAYKDYETYYEGTLTVRLDGKDASFPICGGAGC